MKRKRSRAPLVAARPAADASLERAEAERCKTCLAAAIVKRLDSRGWTGVDAHNQSGTSAADFSRIRKGKLGRFTIDRLMLMLSRLGCQVIMRVAVLRGYRKTPRPRKTARQHQRELEELRARLIREWQSRAPGDRSGK